MKDIAIAVLCLIFFSYAGSVQSQSVATTTNSLTAGSGQSVRTVIVYSSKYGTTEKVANMIAEKIESNNDVTLVSLVDNPRPDLSAYDKIILGTSIYMGKPRDEMKDFTRKNEAAFAGKTVGLFVCGGEKKEDKRQKELKSAYPDYLHKMALAEGFMGGEYNFEKMSSFEKKVIKMRAKTSESTSFLDYEAIDAFADKMK